MFVLPATAGATDGLSVAMFAEETAALWPVAVSMEIVRLDSNEGEEESLSSHRMTVEDGQPMDFADVVRTPEGECSFSVRLVARHHARGIIEVEYDLRVAEARYEAMTWERYLLHRLNLSERPEIGDSSLSVTRADIVSGVRKTYRERVEVGGQRFEIRISARSLRG